MANKKILNLEDQRHLYSSLPELFQDLTVEEIREIIVELGLQNILDEQGNLIGIYHVDIYSNKPTYLISDYNIKVAANLYDKGVKKNENITSVRWERDSGVSSEDTAWAQGKTSRELNLTEDDFTSRINSRDVTFKVFVSVGNIVYTDEITYSKTQIFDKLQISSSHDLFLENSPANILMTTVEEGEFSNYKWYIEDNLVASSREFALSVNSIALGGLAIIKVEARDSKGKIYSATKTIPRLTGGSPGTPGQPGPPGISGTVGPSPRLLEFVQGESYENGGTYIDYAYYRTNDTTEGWYTVKLPPGHVSGTMVSAIYSGGIPDPLKFEKAPFAKEMSFGNVVAEQANLAGFLFRNQILTSQAGNNLYCGVTDRGYFPNLTLDGINGLLKFGDRMIQNKDGIVLRDDCGRDRMAFQWVGGVPVLKFYDETGAVTWEAGQSGYVIVTSGTIAPSWGSAVGFARISNLPTDPNISFGNAVYPTGNDTNAQIVKTYVQARSNQVGPNEISLGGSHMVSVRRWFNQNAMPAYPTFSPIQNSGGAEMYNKGDMAANSSHYEGYYITQTPLIMGQEYNAPELLPDGWYMMQGVTGGNGQEMILGPNGQQPGTYIYSVTLVYMKNGNIFKSSYIPLFKYQP